MQQKKCQRVLLAHPSQQQPGQAALQREDGRRRGAQQPQVFSTGQVPSNHRAM